MGRDAENTKKKNKTGKRKTLRNEDKEQRRIQGNSFNTNEHPWFLPSIYQELYLAPKHSLEQSSLYHRILFTVFYELQDIWNSSMIHQSSVYVNISMVI